jgi:hypothetical protein
MADPLPPNDFAMLRFDWEAALDREIVAVRGLEERVISDGGLTWTSIAFDLADAVVVLRVDEDTDQIIVTLEAIEPTDGGTQWVSVAALHSVVGRRFGWCWVSCNSQGYLDAFTVSVDGIEPNLMFVGVASTLECRRTTKLSP